MLDDSPLNIFFKDPPYVIDPEAFIFSYKEADIYGHVISLYSLAVEGYLAISLYHATSKYGIYTIGMHNITDIQVVENSLLIYKNETLVAQLKKQDGFQLSLNQEKAQQ